MRHGGAVPQERLGHNGQIVWRAAAVVPDLAPLRFARRKAVPLQQGKIGVQLAVGIAEQAPFAEDAVEGGAAKAVLLDKTNAAPGNGDHGEPAVVALQQAAQPAEVFFPQPEHLTGPVELVDHQNQVPSRIVQHREQLPQIVLRHHVLHGVALKQGRPVLFGKKILADLPHLGRILRVQAFQRGVKIRLREQRLQHAKDPVMPKAARLFEACFDNGYIGAARLPKPAAQLPHKRAFADAVHAGERIIPAGAACRRLEQIFFKKCQLLLPAVKIRAGGRMMQIEKMLHARLPPVLQPDGKQLDLDLDIQLIYLLGRNVPPVAVGEYAPDHQRAQIAVALLAIVPAQLAYAANALAVRKIGDLL